MNPVLALTHALVVRAERGAGPRGGRPRVRAGAGTQPRSNGRLAARRSRGQAALPGRVNRVYSVRLTTGQQRESHEQRTTRRHRERADCGRADRNPGGIPGPGGQGGAPMKSDPAVQRGQQVFGQYCASCHGPAGKGDGVSGQNLPIKPQDLTVGFQLNPLPDSFLFNIIAHGAQAVGLSPLMAAFKPYLSDVQINEVILYVRTLAEPPFDPKGVLP